MREGIIYWLFEQQESKTSFKKFLLFWIERQQLSTGLTVTAMKASPLRYNRSLAASLSSAYTGRQSLYHHNLFRVTASGHSQYLRGQAKVLPPSLTTATFFAGKWVSTSLKIRKKPPEDLRLFPLNCRQSNLTLPMSPPKLPIYNRRRTAQQQVLHQQ